MEKPNPFQPEFFDELAETWDEDKRHDPGKLERIVEFLRLSSGDVVLDVGTGTGVMIPYLLKKVGPEGRIACVDHSRKMIEVARRKFPSDRFQNVTFRAEDINDTPMGGEFDAILCYSVFPHLVDQGATVRHLSEGLARGGRLEIAHSESRAEINRFHDELGESFHGHHLPSVETLADMMERAGLQVKGKVDTDEMFVIVGVRP
jgi:demethylmenaquinone methyltransferase/2-methoxy-6-polyprenyl-1,4-benzoquinol methylase